MAPLLKLEVGSVIIVDEGGTLFKAGKGVDFFFQNILEERQLRCLQWLQNVFQSKVFDPIPGGCPVWGRFR